MNNNEPIQISEFDVLCFLDDRPFSLSKTVRFDEFKENLEKRAFHQAKDKPLLDNGVECELLQPGSQGWQRGKVRIRIEFIPDKLNYLSELDALRSNVVEQEVLDLIDESEVRC